MGNKLYTKKGRLKTKVAKLKIKNNIQSLALNRWQETVEVQAKEILRLSAIVKYLESKGE